MRGCACKAGIRDARRGALGKLVLKTAAVTFSLLIAFALIVFGAVSLVSPSAMVAFSDSLGMTGVGAYYSVAAYERSGDIADLAEAVERSYDAGHYADAADYGSALLKDPGFAGYCSERDAETQGSASILSEYDQYAAGIVSSAQYYAGEKEQALGTALESLGQTFPQNNAVIYLAAAAMSQDDTEFCKTLSERLETLAVEDPAEQGNLQAFLLQLQIYCAA